MRKIMIFLSLLLFITAALAPQKGESASGKAHNKRQQGMTFSRSEKSAAVTKKMQKEYDQGMALKRAGKLVEAGEIFAKIAAANPKDGDAYQQLATIYGWLGQYDDSISVWKKALAIDHKNPEYHAGLARVLSWKGEVAEARAEYLEALKIKRDDFDALVGAGDMELRLGRFLSARGYYLRAQAQKPDDPDLKKKLTGAASPLLWRIDAGYSYDGYHDSTFRVAEQNSYAQIGRGFQSGRSSLWFRHEWQNHFQTTDNTFFAGGSLWPVRPLAVQLEAGFTAMPNFQPTQQFNATVEFPIGKHFTPFINMKYLAYRDGNVNLYMPGLRVVPASWVALTYRSLISKNFAGSDTDGWQARMDMQTGEIFSTYLGYSQGIESFLSFANQVATAFNETIFTGIVFQWSKEWAWRVDYSYENRPRFYFRNSIGTGFTFKF